MTQDTNNNGGQTPAPRRGFWGGVDADLLSGHSSDTSDASAEGAFDGPMRAETAPESVLSAQDRDALSEGTPAQTVGEVAPERQPEEVAAAPSEPANPASGGEAVEGEVPSWLRLSHVVDDTPASPTDSTAQLPRIDSDRVVVRVPTDDAVVYEEARGDADEGVDETMSAPLSPDQVVLQNDEGLMWDEGDDEGLGSASDGLGATAEEDASPADDDDWEYDAWEHESASLLGPEATEADYAPLGTDYDYDDQGTYDDDWYGPAVDDAPSPGGLSARERNVRIGIVVAAVLVALLAVYALGVRRFSDHFLPHASVNGQDVSGYTVEEASRVLAEQTASYSCEVSVGDFSTSVSGSDCSLDRDEDRIAREALASQSAFSWPLSLIMPANLTVDQGTTLDEAALSQKITEAVEDYNSSTLSSANASVDFDEEQGLYVIAGSVEGEALDAEALESAVLSCAHDLISSCSPKRDAVFHAAMLTDLPDYAHSVDNANKVRTTDIPIWVNGEEVIASEAWRNAEWVGIGEGPSVVVDEDGIRTWATDSVSYAVYHRDDWNDFYLDVDAFVEGFSARLAAGNVEGYEAPTVEERRREGLSRDQAYEYAGWNEDMGRYIDVDLTAQFARFFDKDGEIIWESAFVSGSMYEGHSTLTGTFEIYDKETDTVLVGFDYDMDGEPDYETYVSYWMPFYGGLGLHDATWRSNFGGELYYYSGSHGCINLPLEKAGELYDIADIGDTVYVHWEE